MKKFLLLPVIAILLTSCVIYIPGDHVITSRPPEPPAPALPSNDFYGTLEPFASESVYFLMTDRFVDGDKSNNFPDQGGDYPTYIGEMKSGDGRSAYVGYLGGDFKGILNHADYIRDMGFSAIWLTPIVQQPDQAFAGGEPITFGGMFKDGGKTGYHGYWGVNFFELDEHLPSKDLDFQQLVASLEQGYGIKTVLDVVANHGSPSFTMPFDQPMFGEIYDKEGKLVADHMNLHPSELDPNNPLHAMFNTKPDFAQLSDMNENNPAVLDYFVEAYSQWLDQGAHALRIDTIKHMPIDFWRNFAARMRQHRPELFMFAEAFDYNPEFIGRYTQPENGLISVLDFPLQGAMIKTFETDAGDMRDLEQALFLTNGPYHNPYDLMTFYDNHDMARINTDTNGYINVHNWLFTSRGIPVLFYGSEVGFMTGAREHEGGRNYFGAERIAEAPNHPIHQALTRIAKVRQQSIALQRGLQLNLEFSQHTAAFLRVYEHQGVNQTALVLLNKGDDLARFELSEHLMAGVWQEALSGNERRVLDGQTQRFTLPGNSVQVWLINAPTTDPATINKLKQLQLL
jgi:glycosidase